MAGQEGLQEEALQVSSTYMFVLILLLAAGPQDPYFLHPRSA